MSARSLSATDKRARTVCRVVVLMAIVNFTAFLWASMALGGDALNGKAEGGRFFLSDHGRRTEVSEAIFRYSTLHGYSLLLTHPLAFLASLGLWGLGDPLVRNRVTPSRLAVFAAVVLSFIPVVASGGRFAWVPFVVLPVAILTEMALRWRQPTDPPTGSGSGDA